MTDPAGGEAQTATERKLDEPCGNCGRARWRHHYFAEFGLLCPGNKGVGSFHHD